MSQVKSCPRGLTVAVLSGLGIFVYIPDNDVVHASRNKEHLGHVMKGQTNED